MPFVVISKNFLQLVTYLSSFGYYGGILPWKLTLEKKSFKLVKTGTAGLPYILVATSHVFTRLGIVAYLIITAIFVDLPEHEFVLAFGNSLTLTSTSVLLIIVSPLAKAPVEKALHGFLRFNEFHMKIYGMGSEKIKNDPLVKFTNLLICTAIICLLVTGPALFMVVSMEWKVAWLLNLVRFPGIDFAFAVFWVFLYTIDWAIHVFMLVLIYAYCNVISSWLARNICQGPLTKQVTKENLQLLYRGHQVLHRYMSEWIFYLLPIFVGLAIILLILMLYEVIGLYRDLDAFMLIGCFIMVILAQSCLKMFFQRADVFIENSMAYPLSFQQMDQMCTKLDKAFFKSLTPIVWWIGHWMTCTNSTFAMIMQDVVITCVIDLILSRK